MSANTTADPLTALENRVIFLEKSLEDATKKATIVAIIAAVLGSGGAASLLQLWTGARVQRAEGALKEAQAKYADRDFAKHWRTKSTKAGSSKS